MIFTELFIICTFKDKNLAESMKKFGSAEPVEPAFYNSEQTLPNGTQPLGTDNKDSSDKYCRDDRDSSNFMRVVIGGM